MTVEERVIARNRPAVPGAVVAGPDPSGVPGGTAAKPPTRMREFNRFIDCTMHTLTGTEAKVWLAFWRFADKDTGLCEASYATVAERVGCSDRQVKNVVNGTDGLKARGLLSLVRRGGLRRGPNVFRVHPIAPE